MALSRRTGQRFQGAIWPGFVDAMTGLLLVLMFVLTIFMVVQFVLREQISGQESELNALSDEIELLANALGLEERKSSQLEARMGALNATLSETQTDLESAQAEIDQQSSLIAALTAQRDRQEAALEQAQTQITDFEAQVATLLASRNEARDQIAALQDEREALQDRQVELLSEQEALNAALAQSRSETDAQAEAARLAAARREALEALVADLRRQQAEAETEAAELDSQVIALEQQLSEEEAARLAEAAAAEALRNRLQNADAELTAMTLSLEKQRQEAEDTLTLLAAAQAAKQDLDALLAEALERADSAAAQAEAAASRADQAEGELAQARSDAADQEALRARLMAALAAQEAAQSEAEEQLSRAEQRARRLAQARQTLSEQEQISEEARREAALLNQQVTALRTQLGQLQALLDDYEQRDATARVQIQNLGSDLNAALARAASEERKRRLLEEAERKRLEQEREELAARAEELETEAQDLERYRSEFFGRLRDLLGNQEGIRIEGDRFVFSSEVLFPTGSAELSLDGKFEVAKVAGILRSIASSIPSEIDWIIRVDGHTDNTPLAGGARYADNWELSQGRALSVVKYMVEELGVPPRRLSANGFGEYQPVNPADTPEARAQNRRIELKLTER
ncbi:peptidoglycan -binding protein [Pseudooceanicola sp.]